MARYADRPVLVCGGKGDAARRIAESYGLKRPYLLQDVVAWRGSVWDRYELTEEEEGFVRVCPLCDLLSWVVDMGCYGGILPSICACPR